MYANSIPPILSTKYLWVFLFTFDLGICDLLRRFTFWKLERLEKEKSRANEDFLEDALSDDTAETPSEYIVNCKGT